MKKPELRYSRFSVNLEVFWPQNTHFRSLLAISHREYVFCINWSYSEGPIQKYWNLAILWHNICQNRHSRPYLGVYVSAHSSVILSPIWTNKKSKCIYSSRRIDSRKELSSTTFLSKVSILVPPGATWCHRCHFGGTHPDIISKVAPYVYLSPTNNISTLKIPKKIGWTPPPIKQLVCKF